MKRYLVFYWSVYYPRGGMRDFQKDFTNKQEAESFLLNCFEEDGGDRCCHEGEVFDLTLGENILEMHTTC